VRQTQIGTAYLRCPEAVKHHRLHRHALRHCARGMQPCWTNVFLRATRHAAIANRARYRARPDLGCSTGFPAAYRGAKTLAGRGGVKRLAATSLRSGSGQSAPLGKEMPAKALTLKLARESNRTVQASRTRMIGRRQRPYCMSEEGVTWGSFMLADAGHVVVVDDDASFPTNGGQVFGRSQYARPSLPRTEPS